MIPARLHPPEVGTPGEYGVRLMYLDYNVSKHYKLVLVAIFTGSFTWLHNRGQ